MSNLFLFFFLKAFSAFRYLFAANLVHSPHLTFRAIDLVSSQTIFASLCISVVLSLPTMNFTKSQTHFNPSQLWFVFFFVSSIEEIRLKINLLLASCVRLCCVILLLSQHYSWFLESLIFFKEPNFTNDCVVERNAWIFAVTKSYHWRIFLRSIPISKKFSLHITNL